MLFDQAIFKKVWRNVKSMQILIFKNRFFMSVGFFIALSGLCVLSSGCGNNSSESNNQNAGSYGQLSGSNDQPVYIKFRSFQNIDSTWGFTIFVNSKPFIHHRRIPLSGAKSGFILKEDAEKVAGLFIRLIQDGDFNPELNKKILDSLEILMN
jgi:hypothetical protein